MLRAIETPHYSIILLFVIVVLFPFSLQDPFVNVLNDGISIIQFDAIGCDGYKSLELNENVLYVGGKDALYRQNPANISEPAGGKIAWKVPRKQYRKCVALPQGKAKMCHNYIRLIQAYNTSHMLLCGSMALDAVNMFLHKKSGNLQKSNLGDPLCSYNPEERVTSVMGIEGGSFSSVAGTSRPHISSAMGILMNLPQSDSLLTSEGPGKMINGKATFAHSFSAIDNHYPDRPMKKMYFVFGESVNKQYNPYSFGTRIAQVCANDRGDWRNGWTSFLKVGILCQTNENEPFVFNSVTHSVASDDGILYGTFNTQSSLFRSGAVCAYRIRDIQRAFHFNKFVSMSENGEYRERSSQIPVDPSPGDCAYPGMRGNPNPTSKNFTPEFVNFMTNHHLVATTVTPFQPLQDKSHSTGPLLTRDKETFTQIQVESVSDLSRKRHNVLFVGTDAGNLIKFVSVENENGGIDDIQLSEYKLNEGKITGLLLSTSLHQLYVQTETKVLQVSTGNCDVYPESCPFCDPCRMCVASRDPACAWDFQTSQCVDIRDTSKSSHLLQDVKSGNVDVCGDVMTRNDEMATPQIGFSVILGQPVTNPSVTVKWFNRTDCDVQLTDSPKSRDYDITSDCRLVISSFSIYDVTSVFVATYWVEESKNVGKQIISFVVVPPTISPKTTITSKTMKAPDIVVTTSSQSFPSEKSLNTTLITDGSSVTPQPVNESTISFVIVLVLGIAIAVFVLVSCIMIRFYKQRRKHTASGKPSSDGISGEDFDVKIPLKTIAAPVSDEIKLEKKELYPMSYDCVDSRSSSLQQDGIKFIDDPDLSRKPPQRTKSVSKKDIQIKIADDEYKFRSIKRHGTRKTIMIEVDIPPELEFDAEDTSHVDSGYEKLFGSPSVTDVSAMPETNLSPTVSEGVSHPSFRVRSESFEKFLPSKSTESDDLMKDSLLSHLFPESSRHSSPPHYLPTGEIPNKLLSSSYNPRLKSNRSSPRDQPANRLPAPSRENKSSTSTNSTQSFQTAPSSPTHKVDCSTPQQPGAVT